MQRSGGDDGAEGCIVRDAALGSHGSSITAEVDGQRLSADLSVHTHADQQVSCAPAALPLTP